MRNIAYSLSEAIKLTSVGRTTLYGAIRRGELQTRKIGRRTIILADDLSAWASGLPRGIDGSVSASNSNEVRK